MHYPPSECPSANLFLDDCQSPNSQLSKTEFLLIGLRKQLDKIHNSSLNTTHYARNLEFIFEFILPSLIKFPPSPYHIRQLCCIRPCLDSNTARTIATSIVHSKLDYCNLSTATYLSLRSPASNRSRTLLPVSLLKLLNAVTSLLSYTLFIGSK